MDQELRVEDLNFGYGNQTLFRDFAFATDGRLILLRGPSGCGKTTLLKLIAGVLKPASVKSMSTPQDAYMIVQEDALAPWLTGMQNITRYTRITPTEVEERNGREVVGDLLDKLTGEMSFGQRRIIELYRAVLLAPSLLLLDEPLNFLDPTSRSKFCSLLFDKNFLKRTRVIMTSHYKEDFNDVSLCEFVFDGSTPVSNLAEIQRE